jgi:hypothetical protein
MNPEAREGNLKTMRNDERDRGGGKNTQNAREVYRNNEEQWKNEQREESGE